MKNSVRILGIDPGTATTGFAVLEVEKNKLKLLDYGCIKTSPKKTASERLLEIGEDLEKLLTNWKPQKAAIEKVFFAKNVTTAISVAQARGVVLYEIEKRKIELTEYTPLQIKLYICGYGKADKKMVQQMVKSILHLEKIPKPDDAADAIAAAICLSSSSLIKK